MNKDENERIKSVIKDACEKILYRDIEKIFYSSELSDEKKKKKISEGLYSFVVASIKTIIVYGESKNE